MARVLVSQWGTVTNIPYYSSGVMGGIARNPVRGVDTILSGFDITVQKAGYAAVRLYNSGVYYSSAENVYYCMFPLPESGYEVGIYKPNNTILAASRIQNTPYYDSVGENNIFMESTFISASGDGTIFHYFNMSIYPSSLGGTYSWDPDIPIFNNLNDFINYVSTPIIEYQWKSIKTLKLKTDFDPFLVRDWYNTGQESMLISYIPDEHLGNLDANTPVYNGRYFEIKTPSLANIVTGYDTTGVLKRIVLKNFNTLKVTRSISGLVGESYQFDFIEGEHNTVIYSTSINIGLSSGNPYLGFLVDSENVSAKLNIIYLKSLYNSATGVTEQTVDYNTISMSASEMQALYTWLYENYDEDDETSTQDLENPIQGGDEVDPVVNKPLNTVDLPTKGAVMSGFIKLYDISDQDLQDLCDFMWDDSLLTNLGRLFNDPREIIVGLMVFPFKPTHTTSNVTIYAGNLSTGIKADLLTSEYEKISAGHARVPKGNSDFMSFSPYRKIKLFIPYCGEHDLDPSAVYGATLRLYYHISFFSGNCIAVVSRQFEGGEEEPMWFFGGQLGYNIPLSSEDFTRTLSGLISAGATIGGALATGGASMAAAGAGKNAGLAQGVVKAQTGAKVAKGVAGAMNGSLAPGVSYSSGGGASSGFLGCQQPYLLIESAITAFDGDQYEYVGNTFNKTMKLDDCSGFTKCYEAHIEGLSATENELAEIDDWLTNGVIIKHDGSTTPSDTPTVAGNTVITFMKCSSERNVIGKTWSDDVAIEGKLIYDQSIETPSIIIDGDVIGKNYAYIGLFKRFYYITDIKILKNSRMQIDLKSDPLQSFAENILDCSAAVDRQASKGNSFVEDPYMWTQINKDVSIIPFEDTGLPVDFDHVNDTYILTIAGH